MIFWIANIILWVLAIFGVCFIVLLVLGRVRHSRDRVDRENSQWGVRRFNVDDSMVVCVA